jgi:MarR family transcriptional regulator, lower aerobic nicotinate degradation pathway regulator
MQKYNLLSDLLVYLDEFESEWKGIDTNLNDFAGWLHQKLKRPLLDNLQEKSVAGPLDPPERQQGETVESAIARLFVFISRYAKLYFKKAFDNTLIQSAEEFSYLVILWTFESLSKTELIQKNIHEKASGMEIINRLTDKGLTEQFDDRHDRRSKRIRITPAGTQALLASFANTRIVSALMTANLDETEKATLFYLLKKLDHFHYHIFMEDKPKTLNDLKKYSSPNPGGDSAP